MAENITPSGPTDRLSQLLCCSRDIPSEQLKCDVVKFLQLLLKSRPYCHRQVREGYTTKMVNTRKSKSISSVTERVILPWGLLTIYLLTWCTLTAFT